MQTEKEVQDFENSIEGKKQKIKSWFRNPYNLALIGLFLLGFGIRIYYFIITKNQPLWWDEGEYGLKAKALAFGTPETGWYGAREIVVPFLFSLILKIGGNETTWRLVQLLVSCATIFMVYLLGKEMFNKKIAMIATLIMSVNAIHLFFSCRILTYLWAPLFFLLSFYLFFQGYVQKKGKKYLYFFAIVAALGLSVYGSLAFGLLAIIIYLFITDGFNFLKKKEIWIAGLIGFICLIPQFIYSKLAYGSFIGRWTGLQSSKPANDFSFLFGYFKMMPHLFGTVFTIVIALGIILIILRLIFSYDFVLKNENKRFKSYLLILLWILCVIGFYTYVGVGWSVIYDGFILSSFPALAFSTAGFFSFIYNIKHKKIILVSIIILVLLFGAYQQINYSNSIIKGKLYSFDSVKYAGEWIKEHSEQGDIIISASLPQITYYSERETYPYVRYIATPDDPTIRTTEEDFKKFIIEKKPKYITDSLWEYVPDWVRNYIAKHNDTLKPVQGYFLDAQKTKLSMIIYEVKY